MRGWGRSWAWRRGERTKPTADLKADSTMLPIFSSNARSLARASASSARNHFFPDEEPISDAVSANLVSMEESADVDETLISSTVIKVQEYYPEKNYNATADDNRDDENEHGLCDCFLSRLVELIPCFPHNGLIDNERISGDGETDNGNYDDRISTIECILLQAFEDFREPDSSPAIDTEHRLSSNGMMFPPSEWIHDPHLFVATPGSGMRICRIRRVSDPSYHESPEPIHSESYVGHDNFDKDQLMQLPINNGKEHPLHCRVIDFETKLFSGTALLRIRGSNGCRNNERDSKEDSTEHDYFGKHNRKFQLVISGKFKAGVVMADCMSGILLDRQLVTTSDYSNINCVEGLSCLDESDGIIKNVGASDKDKRERSLKRVKRTHCDSLPSKWALRAAVKVAGVFSPRMDADLECASPRLLSPLCSTAQTIIVSRRNGRDFSTRLEAPLAEPPIHSDSSLVEDLRKSSTNDHSRAAKNRVQQRKSAFDAVYDAHAESQANSSRVNASPCFDPDAEYTFEFLQHLVDYNDLSLDLGKVIGKVRLGGALRGQPARFVSAVKQRRHTNPSPNESQWKLENCDFIWSFDLWHKSLILGG
ncbi:hypothetical protein ACHAW5_009099 [Stephanodiscus triporus]|uniref:Domain of unknown function at the cortex 1 domain-containing protein n=1 Tax=Stephanodiscus triporus TaxID=2934178 RepID=A0ABD3P5Q3_9STRA